MRTKVLPVALLPAMLLAVAPAVGAGGQPGPPQERRSGPDLVVGRSMIVGSLNLRYRKAGEGDCILVEGCIGGPGRRRTLEFDTVVINQGNRELQLGRPSLGNPQYEYSPCHGHFHLKGSLEYALARGGDDTVSTYDAATAALALHNANDGSAPASTQTVTAPAPGAVPIAGDWDGDGDATIGFYDAATWRFWLANARDGSDLGAPFRFRPARTAMQPLAGDWDGDGLDTVGLFDPAAVRVYLTNQNKKGPASVAFAPAVGGGDWVAVAGDWDGDDVDSIGLYDRATGAFALRDSTSAGGPDVEFAFGPAGGVPLAGDWDQDGDDTVGVYDAEIGEVALRNQNAEGPPDAVFPRAAGAVPLAGDWDYNMGAALPTVGHKQSFCWLDTQRFFGDGLQHFRDCNTDQGLSVGFGDIYVRGTDCQWIDIEGLPAGVYQLRVSVNDRRTIDETDFDNNVALVKVHIPAPKNQRRPAKVTVERPRPGARVRVGEPVRIRWSVDGAERVTRQELWVYPAHGHLNESLRVEADVPAGARSFVWTPTEEFGGGEWIFVVRAQDERHSVGSEGFAPAPVTVEPRAGAPSAASPSARVRRCGCPAPAADRGRARSR